MTQPPNPPLDSIAQLGCSDGGDDDDTREGIEGFLAEMTVRFLAELGRC